MQTIYLCSLIGVAVAILAVMIDAVVSVSRKPKWGESGARLLVIEAEERRTMQLPFVGADRRSAGPAVRSSEPRQQSYG